ncbi:hypothetical protein DUQ00_17155 [Salmonella bongori]|nr:hypothetical protein [Salmonella bongori]ECC9597996.1 hypothetical protein [Salmonella bongori]
MNPASAGFFVFCSFLLRYSAYVGLVGYGTLLPLRVCRYSVTNNLLIYKTFIKHHLLCLRWATH